MNELRDPIEEALRTPEPALGDEEFSANVLARLPPQRRGTAARRWTVAGAATLGSVLTLALAPPLETVLGSLLPSLSPLNIPPVALSAAAVVVIVMVPALLVFFSERGER
jgi:hypothetical protein